MADGSEGARGRQPAPPAVIRPFVEEDWHAVHEIYAAGIATGIATLTPEVPDYAAWDAAHLKECRLVATVDETVCAFAALLPVSPRPVYSGVAEESVYVAPSVWRRGIGRQLLKRLVIDSEKAGFWTLQAAIFAENTGSVALHEQCGFRTVGVRERIGVLNGRWRDIVLMERRSGRVGG